MEHQSQVPAQTTNKFALLEEGEIEEAIQVKKEAVLNVVRNEKAEANKERKSNPTTTRRTSPRKDGIQSAAKDKLPNPNDAGIEEANKKESTIEWVHRKFGTSKEELKQLNATVNHSCQEVPS